MPGKEVCEGQTEQRIAISTSSTDINGGPGPPKTSTATEEILREMGFRYIDLDKEIPDYKLPLPLRCFVAADDKQLSNEYIDGFFQSMLDLPNSGVDMDDPVRYLHDNALLGDRVMVFVGTCQQLRVLHKLRDLPEELPIVRKDHKPRFQRLTMRQETSRLIDVFLLNYNDCQLL